MIGRWFMNLNDASVARGELDVQRAGAFPAKCHADAIFIDAQVEDVVVVMDAGDGELGPAGGEFRIEKEVASECDWGPSSSASSRRGIAE